MTREAFESLVESALKSLPRRFKRMLKNVAVVVEDWPDAATLEEMSIDPPDTLYGLYRGVELPRRGSSYANVPPDTISIYQGPIEHDCADEREMAELVQDVVIHEIGHYFGLDDERLDELGS